MTDLLNIPTWLQAGHPDREAAVARGKLLLASQPRPKPRKKLPKELRPLGAPPKSSTSKVAGLSDGDLAILHGLGWDDKVLEKLPRKAVQAALNKPRWMTPADETEAMR